MNFEKLDSYLHTLSEECGLPAYGCAVHVGGREVFRVGNDTEDRNFFRFYSATKPLTGFCAMQLIEQGRLGLYDRVADYLPAFSALTYRSEDGIRPLETPPRIWHLLSMSGGFDYDDEFPEMHRLLDSRGQVRSEEALSLLAQRPLHFVPGTHYKYSLGLDILGAVIEKISGMTLAEYMEKNIFMPLGCRELTFYPTREQYDRMPPQLYREGLSGPEKENCFLHARHFPSGGCGLCGTVDDYMLFLDMLANDGVTRDGRRLLGRETMNLFRTPLLNSDAQRELVSDRVEPEWQALGVRTRPVEPLRGMYTADGAAGAYCLAHKESGVAVLFATHVLGDLTLYREVPSTIFRLTCEALGDIL